MGDIITALFNYELKESSYFFKTETVKRSLKGFYILAIVVHFG